DIPPGGSVTRELSFDITDAWNPKTQDVNVTVRHQGTLNPDGFHLDVAPPWGRRIHVASGTGCLPAQNDRDVAIRGSVPRSISGWIIGPWARDASCGLRR